MVIRSSSYCILIPWQLTVRYDRHSGSNWFTQKIGFARQPHVPGGLDLLL